MEIGATYRIYESIYIEKIIYMYIHIYFTIKIYIQNFQVIAAGATVAYIPRLFIRELPQKLYKKRKKNETRKQESIQTRN